jgi:threonine/homoserine/homoserine lactone efflux protein
MTFEVWLAYLVATTVVLLIPGPTIMLVVSYALTEGRRSVWGTVAGVALGDFTAMTLSFLGLGAVLATSAALFTVLKWLGAAYLIWLGIRMIRAKPAVDGEAADRPVRSQRRMMGHAFAVTALNPKSIAFFIAFLPQFMTPAAPLLPQMVVLGGTFLVLAVVNAAGYALLAGRVRAAVCRPAVLRTVNRIGGGILIGAGVMVAAMRRPA